MELMSKIGATMFIVGAITAVAGVVVMLLAMAIEEIW